MLKRVSISFAISTLTGLAVYLLVEFIGSVLAGIEGFSTMTPEYLALFPSDTLALGVTVLLHGGIGATFSAAVVVYEKAELGFILQNLLYLILTGLVWIPVVCFVWQLYRYPAALVSTIGGFVLTYLVMSVVGYNTTKKEVAQINERLTKEF